MSLKWISGFVGLWIWGLLLENNQPQLASHGLTLQAPIYMYEVIEDLPTTTELIIGRAWPQVWGAWLPQTYSLDPHNQPPLSQPIYFNRWLLSWWIKTLMFYFSLHSFLRKLSCITSGVCVCVCVCVFLWNPAWVLPSDQQDPQGFSSELGLTREAFVQSVDWFSSLLRWEWCRSE